MIPVETVLITGGSSWLGHHLVKHLELLLPDLKSIIILDESEFNKTLDYEWKVPIDYRNGSIFDEKILLDSLSNVQAVYHLAEYKTYSMFPDEEKFKRVNIEGTKRLLAACKAVETVKYFIYGSSIDILISGRMHTVNHPEIARIPVDQWAFPGYAKSKLEAEKEVFKHDDFQTIAVRIGPMYGELDTDSWVVGRLRQATRFKGVLPVIGDRQNVIQHTYVGNVACGLVRVLQKMAKDSSVTKETTFLLDDTPLLEMYKHIEPFLKARNCALSEYTLPFLPSYISYKIAEVVLKAANLLFSDVHSYFVKFPSSAYFYTYFFNWIFFNRTRGRLFIDYKPLYTFEEATANSLLYYAKMDIE